MEKKIVRPGDKLSLTIRNETTGEVIRQEYGYGIVWGIVHSSPFETLGGQLNKIETSSGFSGNDMSVADATAAVLATIDRKGRDNRAFGMLLKELTKNIRKTEEEEGNKDDT